MAPPPVHLRPKAHSPPTPRDLHRQSARGDVDPRPGPDAGRAEGLGHGEGRGDAENSGDGDRLRRGGPRPSTRGAFDRLRKPATLLWKHLVTDGPAVAFAFLASRARRVLRLRSRDPGERAAERYLAATGHRVLARNWRSARDRRDEADLIALAPDGVTLLIVEVKRAGGPWDALDRVDRRKRAALWRLLEEVAPPAGGTGPFLRTLPEVTSVRVDLIGVRGGRNAAIARHLTGLFERRVRRARRDA